MKSLLKAALGPLWLRLRYRKLRLKVGLFSLCEDVRFSRYNAIYNFVRLRSVSIGDFSYVANGARIVNAQIGRFCSIGPGARIGLGRHPVAGFVSTHPAFFSVEVRAGATFTDRNHFEESVKVVIGNDVWIGESVLVRDGVSIGDGAVVGAGAVVTKNIPAYAIAAGVPARVVRYRFSPEEIKLVSESKWWERDVEWLRDHAEFFVSIEAFRRLPTATNGSSQ